MTRKNDLIESLIKLHKESNADKLTQTFSLTKSYAKIKVTIIIEEEVRYDGLA